MLFVETGWGSSRHNHRHLCLLAPAFAGATVEDAGGVPAISPIHPGIPSGLWCYLLRRKIPGRGAMPKLATLFASFALAAIATEAVAQQRRPPTVGIRASFEAVDG